MAAPTTPSKQPAPGSGIAPIWMWGLAVIALAVAWKAMPNAHTFIGIFVAIIVFGLWVRESSLITSQVKSVVGSNG